MRDHITYSIEDYLKTIYDLTGNNDLATTTQLSERLNVAPASVTGMIQRMAACEPPLLIYHKHQGVELTPEGRRAALEVIRHHRLLELFLQKTLGYSWDEVHVEADRLEHVITEEMAERIAQVLGQPSQDPHGAPIPNHNLDVPACSNYRLIDLPAGQEAVIERVESDDSDLLRYLSSIGLTPQVHVIVVNYSPYDENLQIKVKGQENILVLGSRITSQLFVNITEK